MFKGFLQQWSIPSCGIGGIAGAFKQKASIHIYTRRINMRADETFKQVSTKGFNH